MILLMLRELTLLLQRDEASPIRDEESLRAARATANRSSERVCRPPVCSFVARVGVNALQ